MPGHRRTSNDFWLSVARKFPKLASACTIPYGLAIRTRLLLYKWGWLSQRQLPCPVICVGNVTVGGTGKTTIVMWLAKRMQSNGVKTGVLSRGYGRSSGPQHLLVSNGQETLVGPQDAGDEAYLIANQCPGVVVAVGSDRYQLGRWVLDQMPIDCFILDDGYQHLGLYRDLNLLLIDALDENGLYALVPLGRLREPLTAVRRASAIILTRVRSGARPHRILDQVGQSIGETIVPILTDFEISEFVHVSSGKQKPPEWVSGKQILIFSGIGNAESFRLLVADLDVKIVEELVFPDHVEYGQADVLMIQQKAQEKRADVVLTTEKDAVKLSSYVHSHEEFWAVRLGIQIGNGKERLEGLIDQVSGQRQSVISV